MADHMTQPLNDFAKDILEDGIIDADEVKKIKERIYEDGVIDREEADFLFMLNDGVSGKENDSSWQGLFVEALSDHVLKDEESPNVLDADESKYLMDKIKGDGKVDAIELALLVNITATAEKCEDAFNTFVLTSVKDAVIEDGIVDKEEVEMLKKVVYGTGGGDGEGVSREEADLIFDINDATTDKTGHDPSWKTFFVEALSKHVLEDEKSPNEIDEDEGDWLIKRIEGDGEYDENEKALLTAIKEKATKIEGKLKFKIDMFVG